jgi:O-antigen ligase
MNSKFTPFTSLSFAIFLAPAVIILLIGVSFFQPDKTVFVVGIPMGFGLILFSWYAPRILALALVALIPLGNFAALSETMSRLTLFKLFFFLPFCVLIVGLIFKRFESPHPHFLDKWIFWWMVANIFLVASSVNKGEAITFCRRLLSLGLFYFMITRFFYRSDRFHLLIQVIIFSTLPSVIIGFIAYFSGNSTFFSRENFRFTGASGIGPGSYCASLLLPIWLSVSRALSDNSGPIKTVSYYMTAVIIAATIPMTLSRSGFLVFSITFLLALIIWHQKLTPIHWGLLMAAVLVGIIALPDSFWERLATLSQMTDVNISDYSLWRRMNYLEVGWNIIKDFPLLGAGPGNFPILHADARYQNEISLIGVQRLPHNMYMQTITETGLLGTFFFTGVLLSSLITAWIGFSSNQEAIQNIAKGLFLPAIGIMLMGIFSHIILTKYFWLAMSLIRILPEVIRQETELKYAGKLT